MVIGIEELFVFLKNQQRQAVEKKAHQKIFEWALTVPHCCSS
jgi:hypothetical protein